MQKLFSILSMLMICVMQTLHAQHCIPSVIIFNTQEQVDNFPIDYPGCTIIDGNVDRIRSFTNLDELSQIPQTGGNVLIDVDSISAIAFPN